MRGLTLSLDFLPPFDRLLLPEPGGLARFFIDEDGLSRGLTELFRDDERDDSGLVFKTFSGLDFKTLQLFPGLAEALAFGDGFKRVACKI